MKQLIVLLFLGLCLFVSSQTCNMPANLAVTYSAATSVSLLFFSTKSLQCIRTVPFSDQRRKDAIDTVEKVYSVYVFRDINKNS